MRTRVRSKDAALIVAMGALVAALFVVSLAVGPVFLPPPTVIAALFGRADAAAGIIVTEIRLPRALLAVMIGGSLGLAGAALQGLLRNPLAAPELFGAPSAAGLAGVVAISFGAVDALSFALPAAAIKIASWLTWTIRKPVKPAAIESIFRGAFWLLRWVVLPLLLVPLASALANEGRPRWRMRRYYLVIPVLALLGLWLPLAIVNWKPSVGGFGMEAASFALRAAFAYALFLGSMLAMARAAGR